MKQRWLLIGVAVLVLVGIGYAVYILAPSLPKTIITPSMHTTQVILGSVVDAQAYTLSNGTLSDAPLAGEGSVVSRSWRESLASTISLIMPPNALGTVLVLETPEGFRQLGSPSSMKDSAVLSPDGMLIAYAELSLPFGEALYSENTDDWHVHVLNLKTDEDTDVGVGYAPYFLSQAPDTILFSTSEGVASVELGSDEEPKVLLQNGMGDIARAARVSPDGAHVIVYDALAGQWNIFSVVQTYPLKLSALGAVQSSFDHVALSDDYFFGGHRDEATGSTTLWRYPLDGISPFMRLEDGELLYTFAEGENPYQIVP